MRAAVLLLMVGCSRSPKVSTVPHKVEIVSWPARPEINCYLADIPLAPEVQPWPENESDVFRRTAVHKRDFDDVVNHVRELNHVISTMSECVQMLLQGRGQ